NDSSFLDWTYLNNTKTAPSAGITHANITLPAPTTPGTHHIRLVTNGYTRRATSSDISVGLQPSISINDVSIAEGNSGTALATFTVTLSRTSSQTVSVA